MSFSSVYFLVFNKDGDGGEEDANFDPGYEPDWAVISNVKKDCSHVPAKDSSAVSASSFFFSANIWRKT